MTSIKETICKENIFCPDCLREDTNIPSLINQPCFLINNRHYCIKHTNEFKSIAAKFHRQSSRARKRTRNEKIKNAWYKGTGKINGHSAKGRLS